MMKSKMKGGGAVMVPSPDKGYGGDEPIDHEFRASLIREAKKDYSKEVGVQDSIKNPLVRGARKAATYVKEKYGDIRDDVHTAVTGDDSAKYRGTQRGVREGHLGYSKGGSVTRADGAAKRGKTKGRTI